MQILVMFWPLLLIVVVIFLVTGILALLKPTYEARAAIGTEATEDKRIYQYKRRQFFMTRAEHECYDALIRAVGEKYYIFAQVHLPTIIDEKIKGQLWEAARWHIDRKSVDFVLCDKEYISPKLAIELDDWSHERQDRQERDHEVERILKEANMPLLRITSTDSLAEKIAEALKQ